MDLLATILEFLNNLINSGLASTVIHFLITNIFSHSNTFSFIKLLNSSGISLFTVLHWINLVLPMFHIYDMEGYLFFVISGINFLIFTFVSANFMMFSTLSPLIWGTWTTFISEFLKYYQKIKKYVSYKLLSGHNLRNESMVCLL